MTYRGYFAVQNESYHIVPMAGGESAKTKGEACLSCAHKVYHDLPDDQLFSNSQCGEWARYQNNARYWLELSEWMRYLYEKHSMLIIMSRKKTLPTSAELIYYMLVLFHFVFLLYKNIYDTYVYVLQQW